MKRFAFFLMLPLSSFCQKIESRKVDKFTGIARVETTAEAIERILGTSTLSVYGSKSSKDGAEAYSLTFYFKTGVVCSTDKQHSATLLLSDSGKLVLPYSGEFKVYGSNDMVFFSVSVTPDDMRRLAGSEVTDIRIETSVYNSDTRIKKKFQGIIKNIAGLLIAG